MIWVLQDRHGRSRDHQAHEGRKNIQLYNSHFMSRFIDFYTKLLLQELATTPSLERF